MPDRQARGGDSGRAADARGRGDDWAHTGRLLRDHLKAELADRSQIQPRVSELLRTLTSNPAEREVAPDERLLSERDSVFEASERAVREGIEERVAPASLVGSADLGDLTLDGKSVLDSKIIDEYLRPKFQSGLTTVIRADPLGDCAKRFAGEDPCLGLLAEPGGSEGATDDTTTSDQQGDTTSDQQEGTGGPDEPPEPVAPLTPETLPALLGALVGGVAPPEDPSIFTEPDRADLGVVEEGVKTFELHAGPADTASLHEFHHLRIAFDHVWQELWDSKVSLQAEELYKHLDALDLDPVEQVSHYGGFSLFSHSLASTLMKLKPDLEHPPAEVISEFDISPAQWSLLKKVVRRTQPKEAKAEEEKIFLLFEEEEEDQEPVQLKPVFASDELLTIALEIVAARDKLKTKLDQLTTFETEAFFFAPGLYDEARAALRLRHDIEVSGQRQRGQKLIDYADHRLDAPEDWTHFHDLLKDLDKTLKEPYRFKIFAANARECSVNFGLVTTYRQHWTPVNYQVGRLVKTTTLAPKEVRRFTKRTAVKRSRSEREVENRLEARRSESTETGRAEREIIEKALRKTNFQLSAEGGVSVGIANVKGATGMSQDASAESQETKKDFREAVSKAAQEYKLERTTEVNLSSSDEFSLDESGEISNPNDEIPVTFLFYELQRRYRVHEEIHRLTPVVLVAQEFPRPDEIDEDWIVAHDWILRRVILDDSFLPALGYLNTRVVGDEFALQEQYQNLQQHRRLIEDLKTEVMSKQGQVERRYAALQKSIESRADALEAEESEGFFQTGIEELFGGDDASPEALQAREDAARDAYERMMKQEQELRGRLEQQSASLAALTDTYSKNLSAHLNQKAQIARLRVHIKQNIMYYMQAIWSHEPPDQRFFRLHDVKVPRLEGEVTYSVQPDPDVSPQPPHWKKPHKVVAKCHVDSDSGYATLEELADLDNLLGFKGNYMMFPLRESNVLTDFMMTPYLDPEFGVRDPDTLGSWTLQDFARYVCCLKERMTEDQFNRMRPGLMQFYRQLLSTPGSTGEMIEIPTDSLYIEALPGTHPILEDFKLRHRVVDVKRAQADLRSVELENVRAAARLLAGDYEDPTIEKKVVFEGDVPTLSPPEP